MVSKTQFDKIQGLIQKGIDEGATLVAGGTGRPEGMTRGYFVRPTVFADVKNDMTIAREEIFGPVLSILALPGRGRGGPHRQRHGVRPLGLRLVRQISTARAGWRRGCAPATCT